ncbi:hypothetical protein [Pseudomonas sp. D3-10]
MMRYPNHSINTPANVATHIGGDEKVSRRTLNSGLRPVTQRRALRGAA